MEPKYLFAIITVIAVSIIQVAAFFFGLDGQMFAATTAIITALIGYIIKGEIDKKTIENKIGVHTIELSNLQKKIDEIINKSR